MDQAGPMSVINIFQKITFPRIAASLPHKAVAPHRWSVAAIWERDDDEVGFAFEQITEVLGPDGDVFVHHSGHIEFDDSDLRQAKVNLKFQAVPIAKAGWVVVNVRASYSEEILGSYRFAIEHDDGEGDDEPESN